MKKVLSTALILGALYGTANAAPLTSPIYMPETGKVLSNLNIGYSMAKFDKKPDGESDKLQKGMNINLNGQVGLMEYLSMNYNFNFDLFRKVYNEDASAKFTDFYMGLTGRLIDADANKMDVIFNIGQEESLYTETDHVYADLTARYGLDLDVYNLGLSAGIKYVNDYENSELKIERDWDIHFKVENEFIFTENFTMGLDMFYNLMSQYKFKDKSGVIPSYKIKAYDEYGFNIDANFSFNENNYMGLYFNMSFNDISNDEYKDLTNYNFGVKFTSQF